MSSEGDADLFGQMLRVENKDIFVDLRQNSNGVYLKIAERNGKSRSTILMPSSGITRLRQVLEEVEQVIAKGGKGVSGRNAGRSTSGPTKGVYVSGLAWSTTSEGLRNYFSQAGQVERAEVVMKTRGDRTISQGYGVVEFSSIEEAQRAVEMLGGTELDGRTLKCREDRKAGDADGEGGGAGSRGFNKEDRVPEPNKVFVTGLPWETTGEDLRGIFSSCGEVSSAEVAQTKRGRSLGHGIVEFLDPASAIAAISTLNKTDVGGRAISVREYYV